MAPRARFELATLRLTAECSTVELPGNCEDNFFIVLWLRRSSQPAAVARFFLQTCPAIAKIVISLACDSANFVIQVCRRSWKRQWKQGGCQNGEKVGAKKQGYWGYFGALKWYLVRTWKPAAIHSSVANSSPHSDREVSSHREGETYSQLPNLC